MRLWELWQRLTHAGQTWPSGDSQVILRNEYGLKFEITGVEYDITSSQVTITVKEK